MSNRVFVDLLLLRSLLYSVSVQCNTAFVYLSNSNLMIYNKKTTFNQAEMKLCNSLLQQSLKTNKKTNQDKNSGKFKNSCLPKIYWFSQKKCKNRCFASKRVTSLQGTSCYGACNAQLLLTKRNGVEQLATLCPTGPP